ncbi:helix-turn-helix domain-containing protein [Nonomuraea sp. ZG12]|uniref:helix-turn-helix domain-containing protein n=1 Tax=Nonomuraea sp. ZG12 TaxID=3452207 RepID=UPI003F889D31
MPAVTRARRTEIQREAARIRQRGQLDRFPVERIVTAMCSAIPEVSALEAWRLALGWTRTEAVQQVAEQYVSDGLLPPGLSQQQLCRFEHGQDRPGSEYSTMLARAYGADPAQLGLTICGCNLANGHVDLGYGQPHKTPTAWAHPPYEVETMSTAAGLPAVRESLHLAVLEYPEGGAVVVEVAEAAVTHYALNYSKHPPAILFSEVHAARSLLMSPMAAVSGQSGGVELRRLLGWMSALLGNLAFHLGDHSGARTHLLTATHLGSSTGDQRLTAWAYGAQSMTTREHGNPEDALLLAEQGVTLAVDDLQRAQLLAWAKLPALAAQGRSDDANAVLTEASRALETAPGESPGRFGFDTAEFRLHAAESHLRLGHLDEAAAQASASIEACQPDTPGWAAATLVLAQAEAPRHPSDAAQRALDVLRRVPAHRLRATARTRLTALSHSLANVDASDVSDLAERVRSLPAHIDSQGGAATA